MMSNSSSPDTGVDKSDKLSDYFGNVFVEMVVKEVADRSVKSSLLTYQLAEKLKDDPVFMGSLINSIPLDLLAKELAFAISSLSIKKNAQADIYKEIMRDAKIEAKSMLAEQMFKEISNA